MPFQCPNCSSPSDRKAMCCLAGGHHSGAHQVEGARGHEDEDPRARGTGGPASFGARRSQDWSHRGRDAHTNRLDPQERWTSWSSLVDKHHLLLVPSRAASHIWSPHSLSHVSHPFWNSLTALFLTCLLLRPSSTYKSSPFLRKLPNFSIDS